MQGITILGSTGTIGVNTLDVIRRHRSQYRVIALTAFSQIERLADQCEEFKPSCVVVVEADAAQRFADLAKKRGIEVEIKQGAEALEEVSRHPDVDIVMAAIVGAAGLNASLAAARAGKRILLANKESLVMSGKLFMDEVKQNGAELLPIDSEHNAIFQCLPVDYTQGLEAVGINKILLTGSGGPLRELPLDKFDDVTPAQAVAHPNWNMGKKISVDSATMMNKGLEIIEACWLFDTNLDKIEVVLHPQSIIHSMVEYADGSILAQLGQPDMRTPIAHALAWPKRIASGVESLDMFSLAKLEFERPDTQRYPCLVLAKQAMAEGGTATTILNAANEVAVDQFLNEQITFTQIADTVDYALKQCTNRAATAIEVIVEADAEARAVALEYIHSLKPKAGVIH